MIRNPRRIRRTAGLVGGIAASLLLAQQLWLDVRARFWYQATDCTVTAVERRPVAEITHNARSYVYRVPIHPFPVFSFRYPAGQSTWTSTGDSASLLTFLSNPPRAPIWADLGDTLPCWYDPADPGRMVLSRGVTRAHVVAALAAGVVALVLKGSRMRQRNHGRR